MKIQSVSYSVKAIKLKHLFKTAVRETCHIYDLMVEITCDNGVSALGSAPAATLVTGDSLESMQFIIENYYKDKLVGLDCDDLKSFTQNISNIVPFNFGAKMAVDMACHSLLAKKENQSLAQSLGATENKALETSVTVSCGEIKDVCKRIEGLIAKGFSRLKIKLGTDIDQDIKTMQTVYDQFSDKSIHFMVDANQGWTQAETFKFIDTMQAKSIALSVLEQPVRAKDIHGMQQITKYFPWPVVADESIFTIEDAKLFFEQDACDIVNIKLAKCGGLYQASKIKALADEYDKQCMVGCMMESPLGIYAAASFAGANNIDLVDLDPVDWVSTEEYERVLLYDAPWVRMVD